MRRIYALSLAAAFVAITAGCKKVNEATEFDIHYSSQVTVPASGVTVNSPVDFITPDVPTDITNKLSSNETARDLIDEIVLTKFRVVSQSGNLDFLKSISIYIKGAGLSDLLIARKSNIPAGSTSIDTEPTNANIKEHLLKDRIQFRLEVTVGTAPTEDQVLKLEQTMRVKGKKIK